MEKFDKAKKLYLESSEIFEKIYNNKYHPDVANAIMNIAVIYSNENNQEEAIQYYEKSIEIYRANNEAKNSNSLGIALRNIGYHTFLFIYLF